jgi:hypothetical protein
MNHEETAERVARCCEKIMHVMAEEKVTKHIAMHSLGAALCQVLSHIESEEAAKYVFGEMLDVVAQTMDLVGQKKKDGNMPSGTKH